MYNKKSVNRAYSSVGKSKTKAQTTHQSFWVWFYVACALLVMLLAILFIFPKLPKLFKLPKLSNLPHSTVQAAKDVITFQAPARLVQTGGRALHASTKRSVVQVLNKMEDLLSQF